MWFSELSRTWQTAPRGLSPAKRPPRPQIFIFGRSLGGAVAVHVADLEAEVDAAYDEACGELQPPYWPCEV